MADIKASDYVKKYDGIVEDSLTSSSVINALSANQGRVLNEKFADYVPTTRKVNNKYLSSDMSLNATDIGLGNVTNNAQVKKITSSVDGNLISWSGTTGDTPSDSGIASTKVVTTDGTQTLTNKTLEDKSNKFGTLSPSTDSINAMKITKADGTTLIAIVDSINNKFKINNILGLPTLTTTQRIALIANIGDEVFDSTLNCTMIYDGIYWIQQ